MSELLARLRITADAGDLIATTARGERALAALRGAATTTGAAMAGSAAGADRMAAGLDRAGDQAQRLEARTRGAASGAALLGGALGAVGAGAFVSDISKAAFAAGGLESGLGAVTDGAGQARSELAFVRREAADVGLTSQAAALQLMNLAAATNETALEGQKTREVWLATAEAGFVLGRSPEQIGRGLEALSQIAGKQVVSMEEVRQQLAEAIPGASALAARAMGLSSAAFIELVESGKLTADEFLPKFAAELRETYGPTIDAYLTTPLGRARQELALTGTSLNDLRAAAGEGFLAGVTDGLASLRTELGDDSTSARARALGESLGEGAAVAAEALATVIDNLDELATAAQLVAGVGLARLLLTTAQAAREGAAAYVAKGLAARAASANVAAGLAAEGVATTSLTGQIRAAAAAEVQRSQATLAAANAARTAAVAQLGQAQAAVAAGASAGVLAQRQALAAQALTAVRLASQQAAAAQVELAAAQNLASFAATRAGAAAIAARGGLQALVGLMGGPWGAAFLAAGAAVYFLVDAHTAEQKALADLYDWVEDATAARERGTDAARALGMATGEVATAEQAAAVYAAALTGEVDKLADANWKGAAAAKAHAIELARLGVLEAKGKVEEAQTAFARRRTINAQGDAAWNPYGPSSGIATRPSAGGDARAVESREYDALVGAVAETQARTAALNALLDDREGLSAYLPGTPPANTAGGGGGASGGGRRDRAADMARDLADAEAAYLSHREAVVAGEAALDDWRVAQAGAEAVARAGSETVRAQAEAVERLAIADERIEQAAAFSRSAERDRQALERRAVAALGGREAMERLRISEAGLEQLHQARVTSLDQLAPLERERVAQALADAEARERQAIATEKAEAAGQTVQELEEQLAAEQRRQAAVGRGIEAEVAYARAEFIRQEVERAGLQVTDEAARAIIDKANALFTLRAATDGSQAAADQERELRLLRLTNRERDLAVRAERILAELAVTKAELSEQERAAMADRRAQTELEAEETAAAIGRITTSLRDGFIRDGKLGMDEVADYAEQQLRAALYDAFLAEPIRIVVEATVDIVNDLARQIFGGNAAKGFLSDLLGMGKSFGGLGRAIGNAGVGASVGSSLGLGSGNALLDMGLSLGGSVLGGMVGGTMLGTALGSIMGPLGALAGMALGSLFKDEKRPYTRADIVAQGGKFVVAGTQTVDGGTSEVADQLGRAITESLNAASKLLGIDVAKLEGLYTTAGFVDGGNFKALGGKGFFGGDIRGMIDYFNQAGRDLKGNTLGAGVSFDQVGTAEDLAEMVVRETILRAIAAGASDLTEQERALVAASESLEEAIELIETARGFGDRLDDMLMELLDPAGFEKKKALDAVEATYQALKAEAERLIGAGLLSADTLDKIEQLRDLQLKAALDAANDNGGTGAFTEARDRLRNWLDGLVVSDVAPGGAIQQRDLALAQYERVLAQAQAGDREALAELATYADRLLRADRAATGSQVEREALFNRVTADVERLIQLSAAEKPLDAAAIAGPIVDALAGSQTALAGVLLTLPASTAAPLLEGILRQPDWATRLLGENVQVPPALQELRDRVTMVAPDAARPIVEAVLAQPPWAAAVTEALTRVTPSIDLVRDALTGLPPEVAGPIVQALALTPAWGSQAVDYLRATTPSLELLTEVTRGLPAETARPIVEALLADPAWAAGLLERLTEIRDGEEPLPDIAGPIIQALALTPEWGGQAVDLLRSLDPSLELLREVTRGLPPEIAQPIVDAVLAEPAWATAMLDQLTTLRDDDQPLPDIAGPIIQALALTPAWGGQAIDLLRTLDPSLELLRDVTRGLPPQIAQPIVDAVLTEPAWAGAMLDRLAALRDEGDPLPDIAGPIIQALAVTPEWGGRTIELLRTLEPSLDLLREVTRGLPPEIAQPIVAALAADPAWATALLGRFDALMADPEWAALLRQAIGEDLTLSIDTLGVILGRLLDLLDNPDVVDPGPGDPEPPVVEDPPGPTDPGPLDPVLPGTGGGGGRDADVIYDDGTTVVRLSDLAGFNARHREQTIAHYRRAQALLDAGRVQGTMFDYGLSEGLPGDDDYVAMRAPSLTGTSLGVPVLGGPLKGMAAGDGSAAALAELTRTVDEGLKAVRAAFEAGLNDLHDATASGLGDLAAASAEQTQAIRDGASAQRVANAHLIAKAAA